MKKKNYFYLAALSLAMTFSMGACSDNNDPNPDGGGKDPVNLDCVGGAGQVGARLFHRIDQTNAHGVGHGSKDDRRSVLLGRSLHGNGHGGSHGDQQIGLVGLEIRDDLRHQARIGVAVIVEDLKGYVLFFSDGLQPRTQIINDLVQRSVIDIVADADGVGRTVLCGGLAAGGQRREKQQRAKRKRKDFFHNTITFQLFF